MLLRKIIKSAEDNGRKFPPFIIRHGSPVFLGQKAAILNQCRDTPRGFIPAPVQFGVWGCNASVTEGQTLAAITDTVIAAVVPAVAVVVCQILRSFICIRMLQIKGIDAQPVMGVAAPQELVDLIHGDKETPLGIVILGGGKANRLTLQVGQPFQYSFRAVKMETQEFSVSLVGGDKALHFPN